MKEHNSSKFVWVSKDIVKTGGIADSLIKAKAVADAALVGHAHKLKMQETKART